MISKHFLFFCLVFFLLTGFLYSQGFTGSGTSGSARMGQPVTISEPVTVAQVKTLPNDSWVVLTGNIVSSLPGGRYYMFRDSTGEITIEIEWSVWRGLSVGMSDKVTIYGELESKRGLPIIEVEAITGVTPANIKRGQAVTITKPISVAEAKNLPHNSWVTLTGNITQIQRGEYFTLKDETGEITVEISGDVWRGISVTPSDKVEVSGEIEIERRQISIDVKAIRKF